MPLSILLLSPFLLRAYVSPCVCVCVFVYTSEVKCPTNMYVMIDSSSRCPPRRPSILRTLDSSAEPVYSPKRVQTSLRIPFHPGHFKFIPFFQLHLRLLIVHVRFAFSIVFSLYSHLVVNTINFFLSRFSTINSFSLTHCEIISFTKKSSSVSFEQYI